MLRFRALLAAVILLSLAACGEASREGAAGDVRTVVDTLGDTVVVRTTGAPAGALVATLDAEVTIGVFEGADEYVLGQVSDLAAGPDGSIYAFDSQVPALRKYDAEGTHVATFGRQGAGPGEYERGTGLAVAPDGRVMLHDPRNSRINLYAADGEPLSTIRIEGSLFTNNSLVLTRDGSIHVKALLGEIEPGKPWPLGFLRYDSTGVLRDSLAPPEIGGPDPPLMVAQADRMRSQLAVPFHPGPEWALSPLGYFVTGTGERYEVTLHRDEGLLRIERDIAPPPVHPEEARQQRDMIESQARRVQPNWRWDGPPVPEVKPYFRGVQAGLDGRIWVRRYVEAEPVDTDSAALAADTTGDLPARHWREGVVYDVFEPDGRFLGEVHVPQRTRLDLMAGDRAWGIVRDSLDVQYIRRWRVDFPLEPTEARTARR